MAAVWMMGVYVLIKEVIDNCIDEHTMGYGKQVDVTIEQKTVTIRDFGRGIPLRKGGRCRQQNQYRRQI